MNLATEPASAAQPSAAPLNDTTRMRDAVFFEGSDASHRYTRFWILLVLASVIAAAGVVADSTATVIGAMIVAPLMTPILGTMLSVVLADRANLLRSLALVILGALTAVAVGWLVGLVVLVEVSADTNSQVAGRVQPGLIDLLAAVATGVVASVALVRRDISDTLPGVAIAISLVPPLTVVGLALESGFERQAWGALLLFLTNVAAILASGTIVMAIYGFHRFAPAKVSVGPPNGTIDRRKAIVVITLLAIAISAQLTTATATAVRDRNREAATLTAARRFASGIDWEVMEVTSRGDTVIVRMEGPLPLPDPEPLRAELERQDVDPSDVRVEFFPIEIVDFE